MEYISENLKTPIAKKCDVLVAGGGIAGISAALAAARSGAKTILLEKQFMLQFIFRFATDSEIR